MADTWKVVVDVLIEGEKPGTRKLVHVPVGGTSGLTRKQAEARRKEIYADLDSRHKRRPALRIVRDVKGVVVSNGTPTN